MNSTLLEQTKNIIVICIFINTFRGKERERECIQTFFLIEKANLDKFQVADLRLFSLKQTSYRLDVEILFQQKGLFIST